MLILTPTERSFGEEIVPLAGRAGTDDALAAAKAGDAKLVDELELWWINVWGPKPTLAQIGYKESDNLDVMAWTILRAAGADGRSLIEWGVGEPCGRCFRRILKRKGCPKCGGSGFVSDDVELSLTDYDLHLVERER